MAGRWALSRGSSDRREPGLGWRDQMRVLRRVLPLMWPEGEPRLKLRVIAAFALIVAATLVNVTLPIGYRPVRVASSATTEIRDMIFAKVQERGLGLIAFTLLNRYHDLTSRVHL